MRTYVVFATLALTPAFGQTYDSIRARMTGGSGDRGKCTLEVVVDGSAEVEVLGAEARMRTLTGARATWRRMDCNMGMPTNPANFKFSPQTGRGKQSLVAEPGKNRGVTMVRIEDPDSGAEGYKFDLEWRGTDGTAPTGGFGNGGFSNAPTTGSIFDSPTAITPAPVPNPGFGVINDGTTMAGWNDQVNFQGRGNGYYRNFRGSDAILNETAVTIDRGGRVQISLTTNQRERILLTGRLVLVDRERLVAALEGGAIVGSMEILLDTRNRVQEFAMTGVGRNRFELRWQTQ